GPVGFASGFDSTESAGALPSDGAAYVACFPSAGALPSGEGACAAGLVSAGRGAVGGGFDEPPQAAIATIRQRRRIDGRYHTDGGDERAGRRVEARASPSNTAERAIVVDPAAVIP